MAYVTQVNCVICKQDLFKWNIIKESEYLLLCNLKNKKNEDFVKKLNSLCFLNSKVEKFFSCQNNHKYHVKCLYEKVTQLDQAGKLVDICPVYYCDQTLNIDLPNFVNLFSEYELQHVLASEPIEDQHEAALLAITDGFLLFRLFQDIPMRLKAAMGILEKHSLDVHAMGDTIKFFDTPRNSAALTPAVEASLLTASRSSHLNGRELAISIVPSTNKEDQTGEKRGGSTRRGRGRPRGGRQDSSRQKPGPAPEPDCSREPENDIEETQSSVTVVKKVHKSSEDAKLVQEKKMQIVKNSANGNVSFHTTKSSKLTKQDVDRSDEHGTFNFSYGASYNDEPKGRRESPQTEGHTKSTPTSKSPEKIKPEEQRRKYSSEREKRSSGNSSSLDKIQRSSSQPVAIAHCSTKKNQSTSSSQSSSRSSSGITETHKRRQQLNSFHSRMENEQSAGSSKGRSSNEMSESNKSWEQQISTEEEVSQLHRNRTPSKGQTIPEKSTKNENKISVDKQPHKDRTPSKDQKIPEKSTKSKNKISVAKQPQSKCSSTVAQKQLHKAATDKDELLQSPPRKKAKTSPTRPSTHSSPGKNLELIKPLENISSSDSELSDVFEEECALPMCRAPGPPFLNAEEVHQQLTDNEILLNEFISQSGSAEQFDASDLLNTTFF